MQGYLSANDNNLFVANKFSTQLLLSKILH